MKKITKKQKIYINLVGKNNNGTFNLRRFNISFSNKKELDLHYGNNFSNSYANIIKKLLDNKKGIILFNGKAGTGKTQIIRYIISDLIDSKLFIYLPKELLAHINSPELVLFLYDIHKMNINRDKNIVLIMEDAEELLSSRDDVNNQFMSNILNITDGLLNDIFEVQIIFTFNTDIENVDKALLRNGRLLYHKEFPYLNKEQSKKLIDYLKLDIEPLEEMSLADIYSNLKDNVAIKELLPIKKTKLGF